MSIDFRHAEPALDGLEIVEVDHEPGVRAQGHFRVLGDDRRLEIVGWALGDELTVTDVVILADGVEAAAAPVALERPDVAEKYADRPAATNCGFRIELAGEGHGVSRLELFAVLEDESREPMGSILCRSRS